MSDRWENEYQSYLHVQGILEGVEYFEKADDKLIRANHEALKEAQMKLNALLYGYATKQGLAA